MPEKKTPTEWSEIYGVVIIDPDGWRLPYSPWWDTPIDQQDWERRLFISTIMVEDNEKYKAARLDKSK